MELLPSCLDFILRLFSLLPPAPPSKSANYPDMPPPKEKWQRYHSPAAIGAGVRAFQEKHSDDTALERLSRKSSLGPLPALWTLPFFSQTIQSLPRRPLERQKEHSLLWREEDLSFL